MQVNMSCFQYCLLRHKCAHRTATQMVQSLWKFNVVKPNPNRHVEWTNSNSTLIHMAGVKGSKTCQCLFPYLRLTFLFHLKLHEVKHLFTISHFRVKEGKRFPSHSLHQQGLTTESCNFNIFIVTHSNKIMKVSA